jgi:hypothetical protein
LIVPWNKRIILCDNKHTGTTIKVSDGFGVSGRLISSRREMRDEG